MDAEFKVKLTSGENYSRSIYSIEDLPRRTNNKTIDKNWGHRGGWEFHALKGILRKGIGQPWSKVYSKIITYVKANYASSLWGDLLRHVRWYVEEHPMYLGDGIYCTSNGRKFSKHRFWNDLYVCPRTGILKEVDDRWCDSKNLRQFDLNADTYRWYKDEIAYIDNRCYRRINNIWYAVILDNIPNRPQNTDTSLFSPRERDWLYKLNLYDVVMKCRIHSGMLHDLACCHGYRTRQNKLVSSDQYEEMVSRELKRRYYSGPTTFLVTERYIYASSIRQLSKVEIRRLGLNDNKQFLKLPNIV